MTYLLDSKENFAVMSSLVTYNTWEFCFIHKSKLL